MVTIRLENESACRCLTCPIKLRQGCDRYKEFCLSRRSCYVAGCTTNSKRMVVSCEKRGDFEE